jgi:hypothetical protein
MNVCNLNSDVAYNNEFMLAKNIDLFVNVILHVDNCICTIYKYIYMYLKRNALGLWPMERNFGYLNFAPEELYTEQICNLCDIY